MHWKKGHLNKGDYSTNILPPSHHQKIRPQLLHVQNNISKLRNSFSILAKLMQPMHARVCQHTQQGMAARRPSGAQQECTTATDTGRAGPIPASNTTRLAQHCVVSPSMCARVAIVAAHMHGFKLCYLHHTVVRCLTGDGPTTSGKLYLLASQLDHMLTISLSTLSTLLFSFLQD